MTLNSRRLLAVIHTLWVLLPISLTALTSPRVIRIRPASQSMTSSTKPEIIVRFNTAIDPASVDYPSFSVFGRWTGVCPGEVFFEDDNRQIRFVPFTGFSAGEWITVSLSKKVKSADGTSMAKGYAWNFWTAAGPGTLDLQEIKRMDLHQEGEERDITPYGAYAGDLNGDGYHDLSVVNELSDDIRVFLNDGAGNYDSFTVYQVPEGSLPSPNEGADFNGAGVLDFAAANIHGHSVSVLMGVSNGTFLPAVTYPAGQKPHGLGILDSNGDGAMDIVVSHKSADHSYHLSLLLNNGDGAFAPSIQFNDGLGNASSCAVADANEDGIMDVFVGSYNEGGEILLWLGDGDGSLKFSTRAKSYAFTWMITVGDVDNDGHVDVVSAGRHSTRSSHPHFTVLRGDGKGNLGAAELYFDDSINAFTSVAIDLGDIDGDGDLDVAISNLGAYINHWTIYENDGAGIFSNPRTFAGGAAGSCAVLHDRDRDGDLDMTGVDESADLLVLFDNPGVPTTVENLADTPSESIPVGFELFQSYPNPFYKDVQSLPRGSSVITIPFSLGQSTRITLELFNLKGQKVATLVKSEMSAGSHQVSVHADRNPAGVYFYRLIALNGALMRKMIVLP